MSEILQPATLTVHQFMAEGEYACPKVIPRFQRAYAWDQDKDEDRIEELLSDIDTAKSRNAISYFIGAMLCIKREKEGRPYHEIVDGQQRLTTLSLIFAVIFHYIRDNKGDANFRKNLGIPPDRVQDFCSSFLYCGGGMLDDVPLSEREYRLEPGDSDRMAYRQIIRDGPAQQNGIKHRNFIDAYNTISQFLRTKMNDHGEKYLKDFVKFLGDNVRIVGIFISDEEDAYEIFEVLNARNMHLEPVDLIKNKLLQCFGNDQKKLNDAYELWQMSFVACGSRAQRMQEYIRCHMQMRAGENKVPKYLYKDLRKFVEGRSQQNAKDLLEDMSKHCHKFSAMFSKDTSFWDKGFDAEIKIYVEYLKKYRVAHTLMFSMLHVAKPATLVLECYRILTTFIKRTRAVRDRMSIIEHYEQSFAGLARDFYLNKGPKTAKTFMTAISTIDADGWHVVPDESFINQLSDRRIKENNAKEMLIELADYLQCAAKKATVIQTEQISLEHILPQKPRTYEEWPDFQGAEMASLYLDKIGNLTLLEKTTENPRASNRKFADKKRLVYAPDKCAILLTNELCNEHEWTRKSVDKRSARLAKLAAEVWSFDSFKN